jgi:hypothetical protein
MRFLSCLPVAAIVALVSPALYADNAPHKPHALSAAEERKWIAAFESHAASDGATALEVLRFAEKMRPREFKLSSIEVGYNGATGEPDAIVIFYWTGQMRLPGDRYSAGYDVHRTGDQLVLTPEVDDVSQSIERGRQAFMEQMDSKYDLDCVDPDTHRKSC